MKLRGAQGFTLIEFIVIISIFAVMAAVALINFSGFRSNVGLTNLAHDIALTIRQAQVFGWSTSTASVSSTGDPLRYPQGVYFPYANGEYARDFTLYTKINTNPLAAAYVPNVDTFVDQIKIQGPNHISDIRVSNDRLDLKLNPQTKTPNGGTSLGGDVSIAFSRPRPEAMFFTGANPLSGVTSDYMGIYIVSDATCPTGASCSVADHVIIVSRFGEITVQ